MILKRRNTPPRYQYGGSRHLQYSKYRCGGSGILSNLIGRKLLQDNVKNLINTVTKSNLAHKAASAVLNGASNTIIRKGVEELTSSAINNIKQKRKTQKVKEYQDIVNSVIHNLATSSIPSTTSIEGIGKGIIYD